jgi:hypothetical protein
MNVLSIVYVLYFFISVSIIHLMARVLSKTSATFLLEAFHGKTDLVFLVDRVIIASFFLANVGFVVSNAPYTYLDHATTGQAIATLLDKLGAAMLFVGFTLFLGVWTIARMRRLGMPATMAR